MMKEEESKRHEASTRLEDGILHTPHRLDKHQPRLQAFLHEMNLELAHNLVAGPLLQQGDNVLLHDKKEHVQAKLPTAGYKPTLAIFT